MKKILVLGGAGYIGSHMVMKLIEEKKDVVVVDNLSTGFKKAVNLKAKFYEGDINDADFLDEIFKKEPISVIVHFAAFSQVNESMNNPLKYYENNLCGTTNLLKVAVKNKIDKIVFSSTAATYGEPKSNPIKETAITNPTNCYGDTKLAVEKMLKWTFLAHNLKYVVLRYFNAAGAHESGEIGEAHNPETHLIPLVLQAATKQRKDISIYGTDYDTKDGSAIRDYIHVTDLAIAHILAIDYLMKGGSCETFNLGNGVGFSVKEIIKSAEKITGQKIIAKEEERRKGDPSILIASSEKAKKILNWQPKYSDIDYILKTAYKWHYNHPNGYNV